MERLTVLYDAACGFCTRCRWWMAKQPAYVELEFIPCGSPEAARRFPGLPPGELTVVDDEGNVYTESRAWIMCLYAMQEYRELSMRLANPVLLPFARHAFSLISAGRRALSRWLGLASEEEIVETLRLGGPPACAGDGAPIPASARCGVCAQPIVDHAAMCTRCKALAHIDCWTYARQCATYGCGNRTSLQIYG